jgi:hypothetical protein
VRRGAERRQKSPDSAPISPRLLLSPYLLCTIWVKRPPKPDPVKRRPPSARHFYLTEPAVPSGLYIRHIPRPANAPPVAGYRRHPLCLSFSAALTAPPACLPVLPRPQWTLRLGLAPMMSFNYWLGPPGQAFLRPRCHPPYSRPFRRQCEWWSLYFAPELRRCQEEISQRWRMWLA